MRGRRGLLASLVTAALLGGCPSTPNDNGDARSSDEERAEQFYVSGIRYFEIRDHQKARNNFLWALDLDPRHAGALNGLGQVSYQVGTRFHGNGDFDRAIRYYRDAEIYFRDALKEDPHLPHAWRGLGAARFRWMALVPSREQEEHRRTAEDAFRRALREDPGFSRAWFDLWALYADWGKVPEAREAMEKYLELREDAPEREEMERLQRELEFRPR